MNKTIVITGATSGMGNAFARIFARSGYQVFATYRNESDAKELSAIERVHPIRMDVADPHDIERAYRQISDLVHEDGLYAIINNAGITYTAPFEFAAEDRVRSVMDVNVMAPYRITQRFLPLLKRHNSRNDVKARVMNIASWAGQIGQPFIPFYNASKAALMALSESMFYDLGLLDIHVVLVSPGVTKTPLLKKTVEDGLDNMKGVPEEGRKFYRKYFDHYSTLAAGSYDSRFLPTAGDIAGRVLRIVEAEKPKFKYNVGFDARLVDAVLARAIPFCWRAGLVRRMYKLNG